MCEKVIAAEPGPSHVRLRTRHLPAFKNLLQASTLSQGGLNRGQLTVASRRLDLESFLPKIARLDEA